MSECSVMSDSAISWTITLQASLFMEFFRQEYWSGLPFLTPGDLPDPGIELESCVSCIGRQVLLPLSHLENPLILYCVLVTQSCPTLCDPMDCSPPGSSLPGILQARIPEWVAMPFSILCIRV